MTIYYNGATPAPRNSGGLDFFGYPIQKGDWVLRIDDTHSYIKYGDILQVVEVDGDYIKFANGTAGDCICFVRLKGKP